ncbi:unnamed protein product [Mytilus edulis]|uniref:DEP domain-containing protein n=1 Tax=Mytilus edulis TaxID=6550 RepID=A0A8S3RYW8_MYTED|nr:unnamed protein product [Mytilus edulis]
MRSQYHLVLQPETMCKVLKLKNNILHVYAICVATIHYNCKFDDGSLVRNKSTFTPNTGRDEYLDSFIDTISKLPINYHNTKQNLSRREKKSLEELKNNPSIILKEADKGGGILRKNNDKSTIRKIKRLVKEYSESFTANEIAYLCDFTPKEANFYGLPKIHKSNTIQTAVKHQNKKYIESPNPSDLKLRPIVAGPESPTQRMSHFLDLILKKLCPLIPSYVRDDIDFLRYIPETVPKNTLLTTFDVTSLYTNIPHDLGTTAIKYWVEINREIVDGRFDTELIITDKPTFAALVKEVQENEVPTSGPQPPDPSTALEETELSGFTCELDEYAQLVKDLRASGLIKDNRQGLLTVHKNSFSGKEFVDWIVKTKELDRSIALEMGQALIDKHFGHNVKSKETFQDADVYYRLLDDDESEALNSGTMSDCEPRPAGEVGEDIRKLILKIYNVFLSKDGRKVNYKGITASSEFEVYKTRTKELQRVQVATASREEKLAFFINIYNALVVHANVVKGPPNGLWQRYKFFNTVKYIIGGHSYSLQDIENGVLRANRKGVGMFTKPFSKSDPRFKIALEKHEPLIHFALVCGAKSCPPIKTYSVEHIYGELKGAAEAFWRVMMVFLLT